MGRKMSKVRPIQSLLVIAAVVLLNPAARATTCSPYPYPNLSNGTPADATQVKANFDSIMTCANSSLAPLASPSFTGNIGINVSALTNAGITIGGTGSPSGGGAAGIENEPNWDSAGLSVVGIGYDSYFALAG